MHHTKVVSSVSSQGHWVFKCASIMIQCVPQRKLYCSNCRASRSVWVGLVKEGIGCPTCGTQLKASAKKAVKKSTAVNKSIPAPQPTTPRSQSGMRKRLDDLLDDHPDIEREIKQLQSRLNESERQFDRKNKDLRTHHLNRLKVKLLKEENRLKEIEVKCLNDIKYSRAAIIRVTYFDSDIDQYLKSTTLSLQKYPSTIIQFFKQKKISDAFNGDKVLTKSAKSLSSQSFIVKRLRDDIAKSQNAPLESAPLRNLSYRIDDFKSKFTELEKIQGEIRRLEAVVSQQARVNRQTRQLNDQAISWKDAEKLARDYMRTIGFIDARLTPPGPDGGIDVVSIDAVAQVKWHVAQIGSPELQALFGIAALQGKTALFFAQRYSAEALKWGTRSKMALFRFKPSGDIEAVSSEAKRLLAR